MRLHARCDKVLDILQKGPHERPDRERAQRPPYNALIDEAVLFEMRRFLHASLSTTTAQLTNSRAREHLPLACNIQHVVNALCERVSQPQAR